LFSSSPLLFWFVVPYPSIPSHLTSPNVFFTSHYHYQQIDHLDIHQPHHRQCATGTHRQGSGFESTGTSSELAYFYNGVDMFGWDGDAGFGVSESDCVSFLTTFFFFFGINIHVVSFFHLSKI
jgi:hypothetical protein